MHIQLLAQAPDMLPYTMRHVTANVYRFVTPTNILRVHCVPSNYTSEDKMLVELHH